MNTIDMSAIDMIYDKHNITPAILIDELYQHAKEHINDVNYINQMLKYTSYYELFDDNLPFIKFLVEQCGATNIHEAAALSSCMDNIKYYIEECGATNLTEILTRGDITNIELEIYLIERGASFESVSDKYIRELLNKGCGVLINKNPSLLAYTEAVPYIKHRNLITNLIKPYFIDDVIIELLAYIPYEIYR